MKVSDDHQSLKIEEICTNKSVHPYVFALFFLDLKSNYWFNEGLC